MRNSDAIRLIKERINIVDIVRRYVDLKPNGSRFVAPCPFHQETRPSFSVNPDQGFFYCFGCQASGDIFEFYSRINGLDFRDTLEQLAAEAGITLDEHVFEAGRENRKKESSEKSLLLKLHEIATGFFKKNLLQSPTSEIAGYIKKRGLSADICERFELGWSPRDWHALENYFKKASCNLEHAHEAGLLAKSQSGNFYDRFRGRLIFPIKNMSGQVIAFGGRIIAEEDEAKYINSPDTALYHKKEHLYGLAQARRGIASKGFAILTEGYMDVLTLHQYGYTNGTGVLGTALTDEQIMRLGGFTSRMALVFDGDAAGRKAALRSAAMFLSRGIYCSAVCLPEGEDIDSLLRDRGNKAFDKLLENAPEGFKFCAGVLRTLAPREALKWVKEFLSKLEMPELASSYASRFAQELGFSETVLRSELEKDISGRTFKFASKSQTVNQIQNMRDIQIMIYAARYPERLDDLRQIGAQFVLSSERAKEFWKLIETWGAEEVCFHLDEKQKAFWNKHRMPPAPPLDSGDAELSNLREHLESLYDSMHASSLSAALSLRKNEDDFASELEYLQALQEAMEKKNSEQS